MLFPKFGNSSTRLLVAKSFNPCCGLLFKAHRYASKLKMLRMICKGNQSRFPSEAFGAEVSM